MSAVSALVINRPSVVDIGRVKDFMVRNSRLPASAIKGRDLLSHKNVCVVASLGRDVIGVCFCEVASGIKGLELYALDRVALMRFYAVRHEYAMGFEMQKQDSLDAQLLRVVRKEIQAMGVRAICDVWWKEAGRMKDYKEVALRAAGFIPYTTVDRPFSQFGKLKKYVCSLCSTKGCTCPTAIYTVSGNIFSGLG